METLMFMQVNYKILIKGGFIWLFDFIWHTLGPIHKFEYYIAVQIGTTLTLK